MAGKTEVNVLHVEMLGFILSNAVSKHCQVWPQKEKSKTTLPPRKMK